MQITGKLLLNSAESILKDRRNEQKNQSVSDRDLSAKKAGSEEIQSSIEARILKLQSALTQIQSEYTREQTRMSFLEENPQAINKELKFNNSILFPELDHEMDSQALKTNVAGSMEKLMKMLKETQVEMENIYALNFHAQAQNPESISIPSGLSGSAVRDIDPQRVAKLTRNE